MASINGQGLVVDKAKDIVDKEYVRFKLEDGFFLAAVRFNPVGGAYEVCINNNGQLYIYNFSHNLSEIMEGLTRLLSSRENPD